MPDAPITERLLRRHRAACLMLASMLLLLLSVVPLKAGGAPPRPVVIKHGGVYSGTFESLDPRVAAVAIDTDEPVILRHSLVRGVGDLIVSRREHVDVAILDVQGHSIATGKVGRRAGRFVSIEGFDNVRIENCALEGTAGIYLLDYRGDGSRRNSVRIQRNTARNIDGRVSDGKGGFKSGADLVQFVQLDKVRRVAGMSIAWNEIVNEPDRSGVEDVISVYLSSGIRKSPLDIHDNYIRGAYPLRAADDDYSGGGIMLGDGVARDPAADPAFVIARNNQVLDTVNYGIAISAGHDLRFFRNRIVSAGQLPDRRRIKAQNVGAYVWDSYHAGKERFYANGGSDNLIGWSVGKDGRNDWWRPDASTWTDNTHWPGALKDEIYDAEYRRWRAKLDAAKITIGPRAR